MAKTSPSTTDTTVTADETVAGKGRPTPSRREKEAARKRPLVTADRAEARRIAREQRLAQQEKARIGMANGDERYLPMRDRGPVKRFVRDYVDARFSIGELMIPLMLVIIVLTFIPSAEVQLIAILALWGFFVVAILDVVILGIILTRRVKAKFGDKAEKVRWYAAMRALQLRLMRLPKPQVKMGQFPA